MFLWGRQVSGCTLHLTFWEILNSTSLSVHALTISQSSWFIFSPLDSMRYWYIFQKHSVRCLGCSHHSNGCKVHQYTFSSYQLKLFVAYFDCMSNVITTICCSGIKVRIMQKCCYSIISYLHFQCVSLFLPHCFYLIKWLSPRTWTFLYCCFNISLIIWTETVSQNKWRDKSPIRSRILCRHATFDTLYDVTAAVWETIGLAVARLKWNKMMKIKNEGEL